MGLLSFQAKAQSQEDVPPVVDNIDVNFFADGRVRYQWLEQDGLEQTANALTVSVKAGAEIEFGKVFSALVEFEGSEQLIDDFNDTTNGRLDRPIIPDVDGLELNRLQLQTEIIPKTRLTLGRQDFALDNWRFLGAWHFRQNQQSFDGVRAETMLGGARVNLGYFRAVHRHFGNDSPIGEFGGDSFIFNLGHPAPIGQVSVFHYALDLETGLSAAPDNSLSSQTTGFRWQGRRHWKDIGLTWDTSFARQSDYADNPVRFAANYWDVGGALKWRDLEIDLGLETLGSDDGIALQTPLGSLHGFQGVTDRFFRTPPDGLKDHHIRLTYDVGNIGPFKRIQSWAGFHDFNAAEGSRNYGQEINFGLSAKVETVSVLMEYGDFKSQATGADRGLFVNDARALILSASYSFD